MSNPTDIKNAENAIGEYANDDWAITPQQYPAQLTETAPDLAEFLSDSLFAEKAKRYEAADKLAVDYQARFKQRAKYASIAIFVSAAATAFLSSIPMLENMMGDMMRHFSLMGGIVIFIASGMAIFNTQMISQLKLYDQWMKNRAKAEQARLSYFNEAAQCLIKETELPRQCLLEFCSFFRRYQLQVQQNYYEGRSLKHAESLRKTVKIGAFAAVIVAAFSGSAGLAGFFEADLMDYASLGTIGVALMALSSRLESINQDERNASRYRTTADVLSQIAEKYSGVQRALTRGDDPAILLSFVKAVHEQLANEHREWTEDAAEINKSYLELVEAEKQE
ncbi:DUF4231 domain-containing protein [Teredinibacter franksiae]|uniref:DUF4231 domain-containing protein n=1 Tax=Teredinibacter franksiae TaxID=2761453 RepID=UPI00162A7C8A|nr:DUF4231 domain-containing protein [Teredinibacter franksiae]